MYILNELVLLFVAYFKVVFQAFPSLFVGLAEKLDKALAAAPHVYGNPRSYELLFELLVQLGAMDIAAMCILTCMIQDINKVTDSSGTFNSGSSAYVTKVYSLKLTGNSSLYEQLNQFDELVTKAIEYTPLPMGLTLGTSVHPALQDQCIFQILAGALYEFAQIISHTESHLTLIDILAAIRSKSITTVDEIRKQIVLHSKLGKFQP